MGKPLQVFCCYAREDRSLLKELKKHLTPLEHKELIKIRSDVDIQAGDEWEKLTFRLKGDTRTSLEIL